MLIVMCFFSYGVRKGEKDFKHDSQLHITFEQLKNRKGSIQCFAIYVPETVAYENRFEVALQMVDIFIMKFYPYQV